jgi:hypothetical protein
MTTQNYPGRLTSSQVGLQQNQTRKSFIFKS